MNTNDFDYFLNNDLPVNPNKGKPSTEKKIKPKILFIDDDRNFREALLAVLEKKYDVISCASGNEGLDALTPDIKAVILDIKMGTRDGFSTYDEIKNILPDLPIIFHSAYQDLKDPYDIMNKYRPFAYITKTGNITELFDTLDSAIKYSQKMEENINLVKELTILNSSLEEKVKARTKELTLANKKLCESEVELNKMVDTKNKFFSIIAHDLRSPFHTLLSLTEILEKEYKELKEDELKYFIAELFDSTKKTFKLLENLLEWANLQTGKIQFNPRKIDLGVIINEVTDNFLIAAKNKNISLNIEVEKNAVVYADKDMLSLILRNLLSNALKFTYEGGMIKIAATNVNNKANITIQDNGMGMSIEVINKLFKINEKIKTAGTAKEPGSGLGLILCKEFIDKSGGTIKVESEKTKGSKFIITLPLPK